MLLANQLNGSESQIFSKMKEAESFFEPCQTNPKTASMWLSHLLLWSIEDCRTLFEGVEASCLVRRARENTPKYAANGVRQLHQCSCYPRLRDTTAGGARLLRALLRSGTLLWRVRSCAWHPCGLRFPDGEKETPERIDVGDHEDGYDI